MKEQQSAGESPGQENDEHEHEHGAQWLHAQLHEDMKKHLEEDAANDKSVAGIYDMIGRCYSLPDCNILSQECHQQLTGRGLHVIRDSRLRQLTAAEEHA